MAKKLIVIEDDIFLARVYQAQLQEKGLEVTILETGEKAYDTVKSTKPDLIILDLILPLKNGFNVLEEIKKDKETSTIPVIVLTNLSQPSDINKVQKLGANEYIIKTDVTFKDVMSLIDKYL